MPTYLYDHIHLRPRDPFDARIELLERAAR
jgi:hypothetical protein